jgi:hypothetical protein
MTDNNPEQYAKTEFPRIDTEEGTVKEDKPRQQQNA